jgi:hypothetical protein
MPITLRKTVAKTFNADRLSEELTPLGVISVAYLGFDNDGHQQVPKASREEYGSSTVRGETTYFLADPGELKIVVDSDPGKALDDILAAHDWTARSAGQTRRDNMIADRTIVQAFLDSGQPSPSSDELKAIARIVLEETK